MPRCTCNNCVCCAGVLNGTHVWWAMLSVWHGHLLWDHQTRTPHSLVGPTFLLGFWDCGSLAYSAPNIGFEIFFPNFLFPIGPCGPTVWACGAYWEQRLRVVQFERDLEVFFECKPHQKLTYLSLGWFVFWNFCLW